MKILGIIAEYNPFHNGHAYHINAAKNKSNCDAVVVAMSGNFVQRGEPAIIDKWRRAKSAIYGGADLVIEIPLPFACQNAEMFANAAFKVLENIPIDILSFGCESNNTDTLYKIADLQLNQKDKYNNSIKNYLDLGFSYPESVSNTIKLLLGSYEANTISTPNNILALEYIKNIIRSPINIDILPIIRVGSDYNDTTITNSIASASSIREALFKKDFLLIKNTLPKESFKQIYDFYIKNNFFNSLENYLNIIYYSIIDNGTEHLKEIIDISEGLENKIYKNTLTYKSVNEFIVSLKSKRYTYARIRRILLNILLDFNKQIIEKSKQEITNYIRILASNKNGQQVMKKMKKSNIKIITKTSDYKRYNIDINYNTIFQLTNKTTNIYHLPFKSNDKMLNIEYKKSVNFIDI